MASLESRVKCTTGRQTLKYISLCTLLAIVIILTYNDAIQRSSSDKEGFQSNQRMRPISSAKQRHKVKSSNNTSNTRIRRIPQVVCIGVKKCGTSALKSFLAKHPKIKIPRVDEPHFFDSNSSFSKGEKYYRSMMSPSLESEVTMEKTPKYFVTEWVPERMKIFFESKSALPKLIVVLCNPIDRLYSEYVHILSSRASRITEQVEKSGSPSNLARTGVRALTSYFRSRGWKTPESMEFSHDSDFIQYIRRNYVLSVVTNGLYYLHFRRWLLYFPKEDILVVDGERLLREPWTELDRVQDFLGIPRVIKKENFVYQNETGFFCIGKCPGQTKGRTRSLSGNKTFLHLTNSDRQFLERFYASFNSALYELINNNLNW